MCLSLLEISLCMCVVCVYGVCVVCVCAYGVCVCGVCVWCVCVVCVCVYVVCVCACVSGGSGVCVCVCVCVCADVTEVYDTMSCLPIVSDRAATEESKYFELGLQPHGFLTQNTCSSMYQTYPHETTVHHDYLPHVT